MYEPKPIEHDDQLVCFNHNNPVVAVSFEENKPLQDQLLCGQCISEAIQFSPAQVPWNRVKTMIQEQQKERLSQFEQQLKPIIYSIGDLENIIDQIKKRTQILDEIANTTCSWKKQMVTIRNDECKYSIVKELQILISNKFNSIDDYQMKRVKKSSEPFLKQLCDQFKEFLPSNELVRLQETFGKFKVSFEIFRGIDNAEEETQRMKSNNYQVLFLILLSQTSTIKCICPEHKTLITMINLDKNIELKKRTLCINCQLQNVIPTFKFEEKWKQYQDSISKIRNHKLKILQLQTDQIKKQLIKIRQELIKDFNQIDIVLENQIKNRISLVNKSQYQQQKVKGNYCNNIEQLQLIAEELSSNDNKKELIWDKEYDAMYQQQLKLLGSQYDKLSKSFNGKIADLKKISLFSLIEDSKNSQNIVTDEQLKFSPKKQPDQGQKSKLITYQMINEIKQDQYCQAVAFNNEGTIMIAGFGIYIKIWELKKGMLFSTEKLLSGHTSFVYSFIFSKKQNWFASGSKDTIRCWKATTNNNWVSSLPGVEHKGYVMCLQLNKNEDQLFSCSCDKSIKLWKIDSDNNQLTYSYSLDKHIDVVYCISLNESDTSLVSCSYDKQIIIWGLGQNSKWEFQYFIPNSINDYGYRICFMNNNMIAWQQRSKGITHLFELDEGVFIERPELQVILNTAGNDGYDLFPSVYNKKRNVLIQKHNQYIYIIRQQNDGRFKVQSKPIDCNHEQFYGGLTNDGDYLIIWNNGTKSFQAYKINYEQNI